LARKPSNFLNTWEMCEEPELARIIEPPGGPAARLDTLADAAQRTTDPESSGKRDRSERRDRKMLLLAPEGRKADSRGVRRWLEVGPLKENCLNAQDLPRGPDDDG